MEPPSSRTAVLLFISSLGVYLWSQRLQRREEPSLPTVDLVDLGRSGPTIRQPRAAATVRRRRPAPGAERRSGGLDDRLFAPPVAEGGLFADIEDPLRAGDAALVFHEGTPFLRSAGAGWRRFTGTDWITVPESGVPGAVRALEIRQDGTEIHREPIDAEEGGGP